VWKDGKVVGWITSGGYCHHVGCSYASGYVPSEALAGGTDGAKWEIEILGERRTARLQIDPLFDPTGAKARA
jgi:dimethylglycine dehydrogenase